MLGSILSLEQKGRNTASKGTKQKRPGMLWSKKGMRQRDREWK
jgi:hypothetical protein